MPLNQGSALAFRLPALAAALGRQAAPRVRVAACAVGAGLLLLAGMALGALALSAWAGPSPFGTLTAMILATTATALAGAAGWRLAPRPGSVRGVEESEAKDREIDHPRPGELELRRQGAVLELLRAVAVAANEASSVEPAVRVCLRRVCEFTGWPIGHAYLTVSGRGKLVSSGLWHLADAERFARFRQVTEAIQFGREEILPGCVLATGRPRWIADVTAESSFLRARWANDLGVRAGLAFPLLVGAEVVGVLEFFSTERAKPDSELLGVLADIGAQLGRVVERKRAEQDLARARDAALEASRLKSAFLTNMSHEIRTPLNVILGYNAILAERFPDGPGGRSLLDGIERASHRLLGTIHGILDLSKIETHTFRVAPVATDLAAVVRRHADDFAILAREKGLELRCEIEEPEAGILFDDYCLSSSLANLLQNAIKFTERGGVGIRLYRGADFALRLEIRDSGIGIDPAYLPKLFSPFSQEEEGYTRRYEGSGLGLALTRKYLELNEAELTVSTEKGRGSVFTIGFSKGRELWDRIEDGPGPASAGPGPSSPEALPLVLLVEDDPDTRAYMRTALRGRFRIAEAISGAEARRRLAEQGREVRAVLMDLSLRGDEDGLMLTRFLRGREAWRHLPVIAVTAHAFAEDRDRALEAGCDVYLAKPVDRAELIETVDRLIASSETAGATAAA